MTIPNSGILVLTVGTGKADALEETFLAPVLKSVNEGTWSHVVLLPSQGTVANAQTLADRIADVPVDIRPLPGEEDENDVDAAFAHFSEALDELTEAGTARKDITLDYTRGTKAMSAALVLAGVVHGISRLRYVHGQRGERGLVRPGTEKVGEVLAEVASARLRVSLAERFFVENNFEAVCSLYLENAADLRILPPSLRAKARAYSTVAAAYAAWDRFDYKKALRKLEHLTEDAGDFAPKPAMKSWLEVLAKEFNEDDPAEMAEYVKHLVCDMLANAKRRHRSGHYEDAALRCYRVLELIGQMHLFKHGHHSGRLDPEDREVAHFQKKLTKKSHGLRMQSKRLTAAREQVARFLKFLHDPRGTKLINPPGEFVAWRNTGILVHGFKARAADAKDKLPKYLGDMEQLLIEDDPSARERLSIARLIDFSHSD